MFFSFMGGLGGLREMGEMGVLRELNSPKPAQLKGAANF